MNTFQSRRAQWYAGSNDGRGLGIFDSNKRADRVFDAKSQSFCTAPDRSFIGKPSFCAAVFPFVSLEIARPFETDRTTDRWKTAFA